MAYHVFDFSNESALVTSNTTMAATAFLHKKVHF